MSDLDSIDDKELFASAMAEPETQAEPDRSPEPEVQHADRPRDDHGRFAPKVTEPEAAAQSQPEMAPQTEAQQQDRRVPLNELLEERKTRQRYEQEAQQARQQAEALMQLVQQFQKQPAQPQQPAQPEADPFAALIDNPNDFFSQRLTPIQKAQEEQFEEVGKLFAITQAGGGEVGEKAVDAAMEAIGALRNTDPAAFQAAQVRIMSKPPVQRFREALKLHKEIETTRMVGNDPNAWFEKTLGEKMSDPAFIASLMEKARGVASQGAPQNGGKPATTVQLPPSLSRMTSVASAAESPFEMNDANLFADALR